MVARRAALFAKEVGLDNSILEGDFEIVINTLKNGIMFNSDLGHLLIDTLSHLNSLKSWLVSRTLRLGNDVADALARRACFSFPLSIWVQSVPPDIVNFVNVDLPTSWIIHLWWFLSQKQNFFFPYMLIHCSPFSIYLHDSALIHCLWGKANQHHCISRITRSN